MRLPGILDRRLVIVTGKGGTGKTTVAATLALAAAARGRRVAVIETGRDEHVPALLGGASAPRGERGRRMPCGAWALRIEPYDALAEYLALRVGGRALVGRVLRQPAFRQLMDAAPGWRELITLGKVWHLEQAGGAEGFDLLVVDAPATGHGLTFLDVPRVVVQAVRVGPLRRHAGWVEQMVRDRDQTLLLPVALGEELPARETVELVARLRDEVGVAMDRVVVNHFEPAPFPPSLPDLDERLAALDWDAEREPGTPPRTLAACARHLRTRHALNARHRGWIARQTDLPICTLPRLGDGVRGPDDLQRLVEPLLAEPARVPAEDAA